MAPVKSSDGTVLFTELKAIKERWKEHFFTLLNQEDTADPHACFNLAQRATRSDLSRIFTRKEVDQDIKSTSSGKAPG